jgi:translation elongation factor P/translation initiation factor 5A
VNNNGTGYIKEESIENDGKGEPKVKSFYKKIENGKYVEEPSRSSQKLIEQ